MDVKKENMSLGLSVVSIILSICSILRIKPFVFTNDAILGASLAIISICTAVIVAYQIYNNATIEKRLKKLIGEEYRKNVEQEKLKHEKFIEKDLFFFKLSLVVGVTHIKNPVSLYPIAVNTLADCNENTGTQTETICSILKTLHSTIDVDKISGYDLYKKIEIDSLKRLTKCCDSAFDLLKQISQS